MSKQLAVSAAFSILMMAAYVLLGANSVREPLGPSEGSDSPVQISAPALPAPGTLMPWLR